MVQVGGTRDDLLRLAIFGEHTAEFVTGTIQEGGRVTLLADPVDEIVRQLLSDVDAAFIEDVREPCLSEIRCWSSVSCYEFTFSLTG